MFSLVPLSACAQRKRPRRATAQKKRVLSFRFPHVAGFRPIRHVRSAWFFHFRGHLCGEIGWLFPFVSSACACGPRSHHICRRTLTHKGWRPPARLPHRTSAEKAQRSGAPHLPSGAHPQGVAPSGKATAQNQRRNQPSPAPPARRKKPNIFDKRKCFFSLAGGRAPAGAFRSPLTRSPKSPFSVSIRASSLLTVNDQQARSPINRGSLGREPLQGIFSFPNNKQEKKHHYKILPCRRWLRTVAGGVPPRPPRPLGASFHYVFVGGGFFFFFVFRVGRGVPLPWLLRAAWALAAGGGVLVPCLPAVYLLPAGGRVAGSLEYQVEGVFAVVEKEVGVSDEADILSEVCAVFPNFSGLLAYCCYQDLPCGEFCGCAAEFEYL